MSGKRATRSSLGTAKDAIAAPSSSTSSHKSAEVAEPAQPTARPTAAPPQTPKAQDERPSDNLTGSSSTTGEAEPRRSVRATKGQPSKVFEALENGPEPSKRRQQQQQVKKGGKKAAESSQHEDDEEVIRCICGATSQDDDDASEPWIACDKCGAWQHNVCMGMSVFSEDLPKEYFCEQCKPENHKETLVAIEQGETPWVTRRAKYEEEKKKGKKGKKGKGKRLSDPKDRSSPAASTGKASKPSPTPEVKKEEASQEPQPVKGKRKSHDQVQGPATKLRKGAEGQPVPALPSYTPPADLAESIDKLPSGRKGLAQGIRKSLEAALELAIKADLFSVPQGQNKKTIVERHAIEIERAVHDTHANTTAAAAQGRTLMFNLKANIELAAHVFKRTVTAPRLASMTSDEMATRELQRENAELKAKAEKQSILLQDDGPRMRRTHKGEEIVESDSVAISTEDVPSVLRRQSIRESAGDAGASGDHAGGSDENQVELPADVASGAALRVDTQGTQQSPRQADFDINEVFSKVRSPTSSHQRRPSAPAPLSGPGDDPEVDRLLQDDNPDSPPYSPTENIDPDVIWQGHLMMTNVADLQVVAKHVGGADLKQLRGIAWNDLVPPLLTVAGRIPEDKAVPYLCGLRYNDQIDLVITSLSPAQSHDPGAQAQFRAVIDYFRSKKRYGVVGERKLGNVRDTYLVPVSEGDGPIPEPMQNIGDHLIPLNRTEPMLLMVFVVRDESRSKIPAEGATPVVDRRQSTVPTWSPSTPQGPTFSASHPPSNQSHTPIPPPVIPGQPAPPAQRPTPSSSVTPAPVPIPDVSATRQLQAEGEVKARQVLGPLFSSPSVTFLLPHAARMKEGEWTAVKRCLDRDPRARDDLQLLSRLLTEEGNNARQNGGSHSNGNGNGGGSSNVTQQQAAAATASPGVAQTTLAAATANPNSNIHPTTS